MSVPVREEWCARQVVGHFEAVKSRNVVGIELLKLYESDRDHCVKECAT